MTVQITIIGLGQTGASMGLALAPHNEKIVTVGHDKDFNTERLAKSRGAVEKTNHNLPSSVQNSDLVLLAIPVYDIRETFEHIAGDLKEGAVVADMTPVKTEVSKWAKEILPAHCHYVGLVPAVGPDYLHRMESGLDSARADLFARSTFLLSAAPGTPGEALKLVSDFVNLLGAAAVITDFVESDGLITSAHLLPQLTSAALLSASVDQPGWLEVRKIAARAYYSATSGFSENDDADALSMLSLHNRENVIRALDRMIHTLAEIRQEIEEGDEEAFADRLEAARMGRSKWLGERIRGDWSEMDTEPMEHVSMMERLFGSSPKKRK